MKIVKESIDRFFDYDLHIESRTIYVGDGEDSDGIGPRSSEKLVKALVLFNSTPDKPVRILLNTKGGDIFEGYAMFDAIRSSPCHVTVEVIGSAMSMGAVILQAGDERVIHPNATIMIHDGGDNVDMNLRDLERWARFYEKTDRPRMYHILAKRTGKPAIYWDKRSRNDYILTAEQALAEGLVDKIAGGKNE